MSVFSAQAVVVEFTTRRFDTGAAANADSLPTGTLVVNGADNAAVVTISNVATGRYKATVTLPTLASNDIVELVISATVNAVADSSVIFRDSNDLSLLATLAAYIQSIYAWITGSGAVAQQSKDQPQPLTVAQWAAVAPSVTMSPATNITGWTFALTVRLNGVVVLTSTVATVLDAVNGVFAMPLTSAQTGALPLGIYDYDVWRTNAGNETQLVFGPLTIETEQWK